MGRIDKTHSKIKGFTLIELMTVIGILAVIGTIAVSVITITLRGTKKTDLMETAQQNSDTAMTQMVKKYQIRHQFNYSCNLCSHDDCGFNSHNLCLDASTNNIQL